MTTSYFRHDYLSRFLSHSQIIGGDVMLVDLVTSLFLMSPKGYNVSMLCHHLRLEDILWDEFDRNDDHIVPHQNRIKPAFKGDSCKKRRREVIDISHKAADRSTSEYANQGKGDGFQLLKNTRATMLEKNNWSHTPEGVFSASRDHDSNNEVTSLASHNTGISNRCFKSSRTETIGSEFCDDGPLIGGSCDVVDSNSYCYSLGDISQTDNDLNYYDISSYDDVDRMYSCDSLFGNEDEFSWMKDAIEGSEGVLMPDFKFSCLESSLFKDKPVQHEQCSSVNNSNLDSSSMSSELPFPASEDEKPKALGDWTFMNGSNLASESNSEFTPKEQVIFHENQAKHHDESEGKRKDGCLENGGSFHHTGNVRIKDARLPSGDSCHEVFTSPDILKQEENLGPNSFGYLETHIPCMISSDQVPSCSTSNGIKSKTNGLGSLSAEESSYASNPVSMEIYDDYLFQAPSMTVDEKRKNMPHHQGFQPSFSSNPKHVDLLVHAVSCDSIPVSNHALHFKTEVENSSNAKGVVMRTPADLDTPSCISSGSEKIPFKASSFHQLQQVMDQLDLSTKLCIRDSLYRLARSAEQGHHYANINGGNIGDRDNGGVLMDEGTNNCNGFVEIETNPIDRSIARLLFHRPMDSSVMPSLDCSSLKSNTKIQGSITSPPVISEKLPSREKTACEADNEVVVTDSGE
ncbi:hypothetical protein C3L33_19771, partial [Rhododendron williamsianum]